MCGPGILENFGLNADLKTLIHMMHLDSEGWWMECYDGCRLILECMGGDLLLDFKTLNILI